MSSNKSSNTLLKAAFTALTAAMLVTACADDFDAKSTVVGVRVLGVQVDTPYAKPGTKPHLSMLLIDGSGNRGTRPVNVVWFHGCTNPPGDLFHQCYPSLSQKLGGVYAGKRTRIDKEIPGLISFGTETDVDIPADALSSRPVQNGSFPQGRAFVFFVACGGAVMYDPAWVPPNSSGLPVRCVDPVTNTDLDAKEFVYGYTPLFVFDQLVNANPKIEGFTIGGAPPATVTCDAPAGCPKDHACYGNRCLPVIEACTKSKADDCPSVAFKPGVLRDSAELDPISTALDKTETHESLWIEYAAQNGQFVSGLRVVNDPNRGWNEEYEGKYVAWKAVPGEATLFAIVHDNRGGQAFTSWRVLVR